MTREEARDVLREMHDYMHDGYMTHLAHGGKQDGTIEGDIEALSMAIEALSTERPKGRWIEVPDKVWPHEFKCSCCGRSVYTTIDERRVDKWYPYCHCGSDNRGEEE